jgi:hypothetical protein
MRRLQTVQMRDPMNAPKASPARYREFMGILHPCAVLAPAIRRALSWIRLMREHPKIDVLLVVQPRATVLHGGPEPLDRMYRHEA